MNDMTEAMLDAQYRDQVERWWSPQALSEIHRLLCTVAPLYRETGEHSAIEMSPKEQVSWMCQEIDRLRAELATHCACVFEIASQEGGCDLIEQCKFHASEEENLVRPLRAEIERLTAENERIETEAHGIDESLSLLSQQHKTLEEENERLKGDARRMDWLQSYVGEFTCYRVYPPFERRTPRDADLREWVDRHMLETAKVDAARKAGEEPR